jgi:hypothetical protein
MSTPDINATLAKPSFVRRKSHQRNTVQIDTLISETPFLRLVNDPSIVSPDPSYFVKPNEVDKMTLNPVSEYPTCVNGGDAPTVSPGSGCSSFPRLDH